jgi:hypothetical protein
MKRPSQVSVFQKAFSLISGLKINRTKTEMMWLGSKQNCEELLQGIQPSQKIKSLGIILSHDLEDMIEQNFDAIIREINSTFNIWKTRKLTLAGRICLAKVFGISKLNHIASVMPIPDKYVTRIEVAFNLEK